MSRDFKNKKIIVILGPTASGKSELAVKLAKKFQGEVISADSRQIYRGLDIGTGKITKKEMRGVPHHLLDVTDPKRVFTVTQYRNLALKAIDKIFSKNKVPILCGGTAFYIKSVIEGTVIPQVKPNWKLRKRLEKKSALELFRTLKKLDPRRAKNIDPANPRRLIRAIEIVLATKNPVPEFRQKPLPYPVLILGTKKEKKELSLLIKKRLLKRLKKGMLSEVRKIHRKGVSWKKLESFGLEYRWISRFLQKKIAYGEMLERLQKDIEHFAKRQMLWWKRDKKIRWIKNKKEAGKLAKNFLGK
ncbi:MAG: tRNA (adenosine(37)-N6)-dimethylallyltransferase MiaA [Candidatus Nealsonbacteria bacterium]|nr:tRNA (adenosine(37)-N6)-dimethylallyltransferase MiaA [Candidatus Nealsonbacteria bacterium]